METIVWQIWLANFDLPKIGGHTQMIAAWYKSYIQRQCKSLVEKLSRPQAPASTPGTKINQEAH
jgi:hypothetical protein